MENEEEPTLNEHFNTELLFILRPVIIYYWKNYGSYKTVLK